jgi:ribose transport system ATP-binding protein
MLMTRTPSVDETCQNQNSVRELNSLIRLSGVSKSFPGVKALADVDFDVRPGEVHILFGENGAGKSTLINIMAGALAPDEGRIQFDGYDIDAFRSVEEGRRLGVAAMFQEFSLVPDLSVQENILLNAEPVRAGVLLNKAAARARALEVIDRLQFGIPPHRLVRDLSRAEQQMVELCKALATKPRVLILDEPTASLSDNDVTNLFRLIGELKAEGVGIVYITHRMAEIHQIGDRITVLRDGKRVATMGADRIGREQLVEMMTGEKAGHLFPTIAHAPGEDRLWVRGLTARSAKVRDVSFVVRAGEIVGLAGLVGCGKSEIARCCFGLEPIAAGEVAVAGRRYPRPSPGQMLRDGVCYIPSDRRREGLMLMRAASENLTLTALGLPSLSRYGILRRSHEKTLASQLGQMLRLRPLRLDRDAGTFSGGNQQKIVLARAISRKMNVVMLDEPTVGIDVGARRQIYEILAGFVQKGIAILLVSSDIAEITSLCNRVHVIRDGYLAATFEGPAITERAIVDSFFSH